MLTWEYGNRHANELPDGCIKKYNLFGDQKDFSTSEEHEVGY